MPLGCLWISRLTEVLQGVRRAHAHGALCAQRPGGSAKAFLALLPGALVELLFVSSPEDVALLRDEGAREAMSRGVSDGVMEFLTEAAAARQQGGR